MIMGGISSSASKKITQHPEKFYKDEGGFKKMDGKDIQTDLYLLLSSLRFIINELIDMSQ